MAIPLLFLAILLFSAAYQDQLGYLAKNLEEDSKGFLVWLVAILAIAAIGLIPTMRKVSHGLLALVFLVLFLNNKGIFANIQNISGSVKAPPAPPATQPVVTGGTSSQSTVSPLKESTAPQLTPGGALQGSGGTGLGTGFSGGGNVINFPGVDIKGLSLPALGTGSTL